MVAVGISLLYLLITKTNANTLINKTYLDAAFSFAYPISWTAAIPLQDSSGIYSAAVSPDIFVSHLAPTNFSGTSNFSHIEFNPPNGYTIRIISRISGP